MVGLGPLVLKYILAAGGMGYFRRGAAASHIEAGQLEVVKGAPGNSPIRPMPSIRKQARREPTRGMRYAG
ncbi:hypothetical protein CK227_35165 [Mesorhizobium sp. WSM4308]|nr:hypothetical protein CK232_34675 [Mesorhizobium sp. WSM4304]PBB70852.1 hypothetical protein CK227_35165 [Mesorhizobium sp. WSM4308]